MTEGPTFNRAVVLVADDEPIIADTVVQILNQQGYAAYAAYDGGAAFRAALLKPPALLISDVGLPNINGIELAVMIRRVFPECGVILSSGRSSAGRMPLSAEIAAHQFVFLQKPVHPEVMLEYVSKSFKEQFTLCSADH